jgi:hypothetical protein
MNRIRRREFAKLAVAVAVLAPIAWDSHLTPGQAPDAPKMDPPRLKLTAKQDEDVKKAIERRNQQLTPMRGRALPYDLEPAFVFAAWTRPRAGLKPGVVR